LLRLANGLKLGCLLLHSLPNTTVPELSEIIRDLFDRMGRPNLPIDSSRRLGVGNANKPVWTRW
jgi:hypothetical protein